MGGGGGGGGEGKGGGGVFVSIYKSIVCTSSPLPPGCNKGGDEDFQMRSYRGG